MRISLNELPKTITTKHAVYYQKIGFKSSTIDLKKEDLFTYVQNIAFKMIRTCITDGGCGLAAPQIGIFKSLFVIQDETEKDIFDVYMNPKWTPLDDKKIACLEGCLSVPNKQYKILRYQNIEADYWAFDPDKNLINIKQELNNYLSKVYQHENNHIKGISIVDMFKKQNGR